MSEQYFTVERLGPEGYDEYLKSFAEASAEYWFGDIDDEQVEAIYNWAKTCKDPEVRRILAKENIYEDEDEYLMNTFLNASKLSEARIKNDLEVYEFAKDQKPRKVVWLDAPVLDLSTDLNIRDAVEKIYRTLEAADIYPEDVYCSDPSTQQFEMVIRGDWKHDHAAADHIMFDKFHLSCVNVRAIGDTSDDDYFSARREYRHTGLARGQRYDEAVSKVKGFSEDALAIELEKRIPFIGPKFIKFHGKKRLGWAYDTFTSFDYFGYDRYNPTPDWDKSFMVNLAGATDMRMFLTNDEAQTTWTVSDTKGKKYKVEVPFDDVAALADAIVKGFETCWPARLARVRSDFITYMNNEIENAKDYAKTIEDLKVGYDSLEAACEAKYVDVDIVYKNLAKFEKKIAAAEALKALYESAKKVKKSRKLKEDRYSSTEAELEAIFNGGFEDWYDGIEPNPEKAANIHKAAVAANLSDLDYVNREEDLEVLGEENDFIYDLESSEFAKPEDFKIESPRTVFEGYKKEIEERGAATGNYGHQMTGDYDLCEDLLEGAEQYINDNWVNSFSSHSIEEMIAITAQYYNDPRCSKVKPLYDALVAWAEEFNALAEGYVTGFRTIDIVEPVEAEETVVTDDFYDDDFELYESKKLKEKLGVKGCYGIEVDPIEKASDGKQYGFSVVDEKGVPNTEGEPYEANTKEEALASKIYKMCLKKYGKQNVRVVKF